MDFGGLGEEACVCAHVAGLPKFREKLFYKISSFLFNGAFMCLQLGFVIYLAKLFKVEQIILL